MEFRILGPVEAAVEGRRLPISGRQERLLALLLAESGQVATLDRVIETLWDTEPPATAKQQVHTTVGKLRRVLADAGAAGLVVTVGTGYQLRAEDEQVDARWFDRLLAEADAEARAGRLGAAAGTLRSALRLWHGKALSGLSGTVLQSMAAALDERRLTAIERYADLLLTTGAAAELVGELRAWAIQHPLRERLRAQLMLALYRSGQQAEALTVFDHTRRLLADELGVDPGPELRRLHEQILRNSRELEIPGSGADTAPLPIQPPPNTVDEPAEEPVRPCSLPYDIGDFTGRDSELEGLLAMATDVAADATLVTTIDGMAGVGKTSLAIHAAHRLSHRYPDGQMFIDLRGHTIGHRPLDPATALDMLLRSVGVPAAQIPNGVDERAARWRSELAGKRTLILLDNADDVDQVRPLLPGAPGCMAIVTSRKRLVDLDGAGSLSLDVLSGAHASHLFGRITGPERVITEPDAVSEVVELCGRLPVALRIAAARLRHRPSWTVGYLVDRLRDSMRRLAELSTGDRSVAGIFTLSYQHLGESQRRMFRLLGLHPGADVDAHAAAALTGLRVAEAEALLEGLLDHHLLEQYTPGRYTFHDLLRQHARATAEAEESAEARRLAIHRLLDYYLLTATAAAEAINPHGSQAPPSVRYTPADPTPVRDYATAMTWLDTEQHNLRAVIDHAEAGGWAAHAWKLPFALWRFYELRSNLDDWLGIYQRALKTTKDLDDLVGQASIHNRIGIICRRRGKYSEALMHYRRSLTLYRELGDHFAVRRPLHNIAVIYQFLGQHSDAIDHFRQVLALDREFEDRHGEAVTCSNLGGSLAKLGRHAEALRELTHALSLVRDIDDRYREALIREDLGNVHEKLGHHTTAMEYHRRALRLHQDSGNRLGEASSLTNMGNVFRLTGEFGAALARHTRALEIARDFGGREVECVILNNIGAAHRSDGDFAEGLEWHRRALTMARDIGFRAEEAKALDGLAHALSISGDAAVAHTYWSSALEMYTAMGVPEAEDVRRAMDGLAVRRG